MALYRIPSSDAPQFIEGEVHYKVLELGLTNREIFEDLVYPELSLVRHEGRPVLFMPWADKAKLWEEDPFTMSEKGYTLETKILATPLLFGGYGVARLVSFRRVNRPPRISK